MVLLRQDVAEETKLLSAIRSSHATLEGRENASMDKEDRLDELERMLATRAARVEAGARTLEAAKIKHDAQCREELQSLTSSRRELMQTKIEVLS